MITIFQMWTGQGFFQFEKERDAGHEVEMTCPPGEQYLCRGSARCDQSADENVGVENRSRHFDVYGSERSCYGRGSQREWRPDTLSEPIWLEFLPTRD